jgi:hypothetical protein
MRIPSSRGKFTYEGYTTDFNVIIELEDQAYISMFRLLCSAVFIEVRFEQTRIVYRIQLPVECRRAAQEREGGRGNLGTSLLP